MSEQDTPTTAPGEEEWGWEDNVAEEQYASQEHPKIIAQSPPKPRSNYNRNKHMEYSSPNANANRKNKTTNPNTRITSSPSFQELNMAIGATILNANELPGSPHTRNHSAQSENSNATSNYGKANTRGSPRKYESGSASVGCTGNTNGSMPRNRGYSGYRSGYEKRNGSDVAVVIGPEFAPYANYNYTYNIPQSYSYNGLGVQPSPNPNNPNNGAHTPHGLPIFLPQPQPSTHYYQLPGGLSPLHTPMSSHTPWGAHLMQHTSPRGMPPHGGSAGYGNLSPFPVPMGSISNGHTNSNVASTTRLPTVESTPMAIYPPLTHGQMELINRYHAHAAALLPGVEHCAGTGESLSSPVPTTGPAPAGVTSDVTSQATTSSSSSITVDTALSSSHSMPFSDLNIVIDGNVEKTLRAQLKPYYYEYANAEGTDGDELKELSLSPKHQHPAIFTELKSNYKTTMIENECYSMEAPSHALVLFHHPYCIHPDCVLNLCKKYGAIYYIIQDFHVSHGVTFVCYNDVRCSAQAYNGLDKDITNHCNAQLKIMGFKSSTSAECDSNIGGNTVSASVSCTDAAPQGSRCVFYSVILFNTVPESYNSRRVSRASTMVSEPSHSKNATPSITPSTSITNLQLYGTQASASATSSGCNVTGGLTISTAVPPPPPPPPSLLQIATVEECILLATNIPSHHSLGAIECVFRGYGPIRSFSVYQPEAKDQPIMMACKEREHKKVTATVVASDSVGSSDSEPVHYIVEYFRISDCKHAESDLSKNARLIWGGERDGDGSTAADIKRSPPAVTSVALSPIHATIRQYFHIIIGIWISYQTTSIQHQTLAVPVHNPSNSKSVPNSTVSDLGADTEPTDAGQADTSKSRAMSMERNANPRGMLTPMEETDANGHINTQVEASFNVISNLQGGESDSRQIAVSNSSTSTNSSDVKSPQVPTVTASWESNLNDDTDILRQNGTQMRMDANYEQLVQGQAQMQDQWEMRMRGQRTSHGQPQAQMLWYVQSPPQQQPPMHRHGQGHLHAGDAQLGALHSLTLNGKGIQPQQERQQFYTAPPDMGQYNYMTTMSSVGMQTMVPPTPLAPPVPPNLPPMPTHHLRNHPEYQRYMHALRTYNEMVAHAPGYASGPGMKKHLHQGYAGHQTKVPNHPGHHHGRNGVGQQGRNSGSGNGNFAQNSNANAIDLEAVLNNTEKRVTLMVSCTIC